MAAKLSIVLFIQAVLIQLSLSQLYPSLATGNSVVENSVVVGNSGLGNLAGYNTGLAGAGLATSGLAGGNLATSGLAGGNLATSGLAGGNVAASLASSNLAGSLGATTLSSGMTLGGIGLGSLSVAPSGVLAVTSYSPIAPAGINVVSDNTIEGVVNVNGQLPFLSAVAFESSLATSGQGAASCGCGDGYVGITSEGLPSYGLGYGSGLGIGGRRF